MVEAARRLAFAVGLSLLGLIGLAGYASGESHVYVPYSGIERGTVGVAPVFVTIVNDTGAEMVCRVALAHWYAADLGRAGPGDTITATLWHDPDTGVLALLNAGQDRMPVEALWCGREGAVHASRAAIALPFAKGPTESRILRVCVESGARLDCAAAE